jgi:DNA-binding response OmpR family regulator
MNRHYESPIRAGTEPTLRDVEDNARGPEVPRGDLILDQEPTAQPRFRSALESAGYVVFDSTNRELGLSRLRDFWAEPLLRGLRMPRLSGMKVADRSRRYGEAARVLIVATYGVIPDPITVLRSIPVHFSVRPLLPRELAKSIDAVLFPPRGALSRLWEPDVLIGIKPYMFNRFAHRSKPTSTSRRIGLRADGRRLDLTVGDDPFKPSSR